MQRYKSWKAHAYAVLNATSPTCCRVEQLDKFPLRYIACRLAQKLKRKARRLACTSLELSHKKLLRGCSQLPGKFQRRVQMMAFCLLMELQNLAKFSSSLPSTITCAFKTRSQDSQRYKWWDQGGNYFLQYGYAGFKWNTTWTFH